MPSIAMEGKLNVTTKPLHYAVFFIWRERAIFTFYELK